MDCLLISVDKSGFNPISMPRQMARPAGHACAKRVCRGARGL